MKYKMIIPERMRCDCGSKVKDHHWYCDKCWGKRAKQRNMEKKRKILNDDLKKKELIRLT